MENADKEVLDSIELLDPEVIKYFKELQPKLENHRPSVFTSPDLEPKRIKEELSGYVKKAIENASDKYDMLDIDKGTVVLHAREDSHLIPLIEPIIFGELRKLSKEKSPKKYAAIEGLMFTDPEFNNVVKACTGEDLFGETILDHELRHHIGDIDTPNADNYIILKFITEKGREEEVISLIGGLALDPSQDRTRRDYISTYLEPKHLSTEDVRLLKYIERKIVKILPLKDRLSMLLKIKPSPLNTYIPRQTEDGEYFSELENEWLKRHPGLDPKKYG